MSEEMVSQYKIMAYLDGLEESIESAESNGLNQTTVDKIKKAHTYLTELDSQFETDEDYSRLAKDVEDLIENLVEACENGEENRVEENVEALTDKLTSLNLSFGVKKATGLINGNTWTLISTADKNGKVDTAFVGSSAIINDKQLIVAQMLLGRTIDNLKENKNAVLIGYKANEKNVMETKIARVYCTLVDKVTEGPLFDHVKLEATKEAGPTAAGMIRSVLVFDINEIRSSG